MTKIEEKLRFTTLYVHDFQWLNQTDNEKWQGHPRPGRVYPGWCNPNTGNYHLWVPGTGVLLVENLFNKAIWYGFSFEISEVNLDNILDFDITLEDLEEMGGLLESNYEKVRNFVYPKQEINMPSIDIINMKNSQLPLAPIDIIRMASPETYEVIMDVIDHIAQTPPDPTTDWLKLSSHGTGANIQTVLQNLAEYTSDDRRIGGNPENLFNAIEALIIELTRCLK